MDFFDDEAEVSGSDSDASEESGGTAGSLKDFVDDRSEVSGVSFRGHPPLTENTPPIPRKGKN